jgi:hypothetical protein
MYSRRITRKNPGLVVFLLDRSDSMKQKWGNLPYSLAEGASNALNAILLDLLFTSQVEPGKPYHYFDVGVFGYGLRPATRDEGVEPAFAGNLAGQPIIPLPSLRDNQVGMRDEPSEDVGAPPSRVPVWIEPAYGHKTPMCEAIAVAGGHVFNWVSEHPDSFPPIVINITDGMVTDSPFQGAKIDDWAQRLVNIQTSDGPALLFNIFLSPTPANTVVFPPTPAGLPMPGPDLFRISSPLPPPMVANAAGAGMTLQQGARGFAFNADRQTLAAFLNVGTTVGTGD